MAVLLYVMPWGTCLPVCTCAFPCRVHSTYYVHLAVVCSGVEESTLKWTESATIYIVHSTCIL